MGFDLPSLVICSTPDADAVEVAAQVHNIALQNANAGTVRNCNVSDLPQVEKRRGGTARLCLIYTAPDRSISRSILWQSTTIEQAVADWAREARALLDLYRRNRSRSLLFQSGHLRQFSNSGLARIGLAAQDMDLGAQSVWEDAAEPIIATMVAAYLRDYPDLIELSEELAASVQVLSNEAVLTGPVSADRALEAYHRQRLALSEIESALALLQEQKEVMLQELFALERDNMTLAAQLDEKTRKVADLEHLRRSDQKKLVQHGAELDRLQGREQTLQNDLEQSKMLTGHLEAEIGRIMASRSIRVTRPLRWLGRQIRGKNE